MRALLALALLVLSALPVPANDHAWLIGKWELTHAPDGDAKDWVEFTPEGHTVSISPTGQRTLGTYVVTDREVKAVYAFRGREIPISYTIGPERTKLLLYSPKTRSTSTYEKVR